MTNDTTQRRTHAKILEHVESAIRESRLLGRTVDLEPDSVDEFPAMFAALQAQCSIDCDPEEGAVGAGIWQFWASDDEGDDEPIGVLLPPYGITPALDWTVNLHSAG